jgi:signal transduction histidine kinase
MFRTEKLAAVGRLISGVVNELQTPLASISELADRALMRTPATAADREVMAIAAEAQKASAIVSRLVSFAAAEQGDARPVCVTTLLRNLIEFRERDWKASGIRIEDVTLPEPLFVTGTGSSSRPCLRSSFTPSNRWLKLRRRPSPFAPASWPSGCWLKSRSAHRLTRAPRKRPRLYWV